MENSKTSFIDEETFFYSSTSNFGVRSRNLISPRNIKMSFSHLSSNNTISFSNTIMVPFISEENKNEKENVKNSTRTKAESSNNMKEENQLPKIIITKENDRMDEITNILTIGFEEQKTSYENNPFYYSTKSLLSVNNIQNESNKVEMKKVKALLNIKNNNLLNKKEPNLYLKSTKYIRKKSNIENDNHKSTKKLRRMELYNQRSLREENSKNEEGKERKSKSKYKTNRNKGNKFLSLNYYENKKPKLSNKSLNFKKNKDILFRRKSEKTVKNDSSEIEIKDKNNNLYKSSLFNKKSSSRLNQRFDPIQLDKEKIAKIKNDDNNKVKKIKKLFQIV